MKLNKSSNYDIFLKNCKFGKNKILGDILIINNNIICKEKFFNTESEINNEIILIKKFKDIQNDWMVNIIDYSYINVKEFCSEFYKIRIYYEDIKQSLKNEIFERKQSNNKFNFNELTHLLYQINKCLTIFQNNNIIHGDINTDTIFINGNNFKLFPNMINQNVEQIQLNKIYNWSKDIYISPEILHKITSKYLFKIEINYYKSDIYSFGLCILESGLLNNLQDIYMNRTEININLLQNKIILFENQYRNNKLLISSVKKMLENEEELRPDSIKITETLPNYDIIKKYFNNNLIKNEIPIQTINKPCVINNKMDKKYNPVSYKYNNNLNQYNLEQNKNPLTHNNKSSNFITKSKQIKKINMFNDNNNINNYSNSKIIYNPKRFIFNLNSNNKNQQNNNFNNIEDRPETSYNNNEYNIYNRPFSQRGYNNKFKRFN